MPLSGKRLVFAQEYLKDLNAKQAAIRAGYAPGSAHVTGHRLISDANVAAFIAERKAERAEAAGITAERVLRETELLAHSNVKHYMLDDSGTLVLAPGAPPDAMKAISSIKYKSTTYGTGEHARTERTCEFKLWDKPGMVKLAGRHVDVHGFRDDEPANGSIKAQVLNVLVGLPQPLLLEVNRRALALLGNGNGNGHSAP